MVNGQCPGILLVVASVALSAAPAAQDSSLTFDVASIRARTEPSGVANIQVFPGGRLQAINATVVDLIYFAYGFEFTGSTKWPVEGGPEWTHTDKFDIQARWTEDATVPVTGPLRPVNVMLQNLLRDRFKLVVHRDTRQEAAYRLVLARPDGRLGPGLRRSERDCSAVTNRYRAAGADERRRLEEDMVACRARVTDTHVQLRGSTMSQIALQVGFMLKARVLEETGLEGAFDIDLTAAPVLLPGQRAAAAAAADASLGPPIDVALVQQLGLALERAQIPYEMIVIDQVERPTPN